MMSPTYWTASLLKRTAREQGWEIVGSTAPGMVAGEVWGFRKTFRLQRDVVVATTTVTIRIKEDRRGGLTWASLTSEFDGGADVTRLGPDYRGKREKVLGWLAGDASRFETRRKMHYGH